MGGGPTRSPGLASPSFVLLERFQSWCIREALLPSGIFLKKMPPFTTLKRAHELWNRSSHKVSELNIYLRQIQPLI